LLLRSKENVVCTYTELVFSFKKKQNTNKTHQRNPIIWNDVDGPERVYA
jgi:hypothetical protein